MNEPKYKVGDKVRVVGKWIGDMGQNSKGKMDKHLGTKVTISGVYNYDYVYGYKYEIEENIDYWIWYEPMLLSTKDEPVYDINKGWNVC